MAATIAIEDPLAPDICALVAELNSFLLTGTPREHCHHMTPQEMAQPDTTVFVAREDGAAVACGALRCHPGAIGEVKRMYTRPAHRGRGLGGRIVTEIETLARGMGLTLLVLETAQGLAPAWRVYERAGFRRCGPVLDYPDSGWSVFYEKPLWAEAAAA